MKDIKCPLCEKSLSLRNLGRAVTPVWFYKCPRCKYILKDDPTISGARFNAEEFISKFPPIMRLNVGDNLTHFGTSDFVTVVRKDTESCEIQIETPEGELYIIEPKDVHKWPWELEQKGGAEQ